MSKPNGTPGFAEPEGAADGLARPTAGALRGKGVELLHDSPRGRIYLTPGDNINWEVQRPGKAFLRTAAEVRNLLTRLKLTVANKRVLNRALKMVASGVAMALESEFEVDDGRDYLSEAREFITVRQSEALQLRYLGSAALTTLVLAPALFFIARAIEPEIGEFVAAAALGGCGAMLSVAQRFRSIPLERYSGRLSTSAAGCSRVVFGAAFGAVFLLLHRAELLVSVADRNPFLLAALAFVSGFSERLIPELLEQFETRVVARNEAAAEVVEPRVDPYAAF